METEVVERRMNRILAHFSLNQDLSPNHNPFSMNCSSSLNTVIRRCDNRMLFARQGSLSQACFMRQVSDQQDFGHGSSVQQVVPLSSPHSEHVKFSYEHSGAPMFSRPAQTDPNVSPVNDVKPTTEPPKFARPSAGLRGQNKPCVKKIRHASFCNGMEWSPQTDIAESGCNYVMTVELPGVNTNTIRVKVDDKNLIVTGKRSTQWWRVANVSADSNATYLRREILQGPYQVIWPLPNDVNKDGVTAEFVDGFLQITLPKF
ncbi:alpha-crystallin domain 32.1 [Tasmannia lanceolata]|uniref:alpha-crystallin domain 32.1 n=1 Tax=Tasmannia lanceolata TaxID=3420 RepID=UPI00406446FB